jgi:hypothetical protein
MSRTRGPRGRGYRQGLAGTPLVGEGEELIQTGGAEWPVHNRVRCLRCAWSAGGRGASQAGRGCAGRSPDRPGPTHRGPGPGAGRPRRAGAGRRRARPGRRRTRPALTRPSARCRSRTASITYRDHVPRGARPSMGVGASHRGSAAAGVRHSTTNRMRHGHPNGHPDDRTASDWTRPDRRGIPREQGRSDASGRVRL